MNSMLQVITKTATKALPAAEAVLALVVVVSAIKHEIDKHA